MQAFLSVNFLWNYFSEWFSGTYLKGMLKLSDPLLKRKKKILHSVGQQIDTCIT